MLGFFAVVVVVGSRIWKVICHIDSVEWLSCACAVTSACKNLKQYKYINMHFTGGVRVRELSLALASVAISNVTGIGLVLKWLTKAHYLSRLALITFA